MAQTGIVDVIARLMPELKRVWERECGPAVKQAEERSSVQELQACWGDLTSKLFGPFDARFADLRARWEPVARADPLLRRMDLLSPIGLSRRETVHTQALRYLLDPSESHGVAAGPLGALLHLLGATEPDVKGRVTDFAPDAASARVFAEWGDSIPYEGRESRRPRTDIWVEVPSGARTLLLVIENKIDDSVRAGQLEAYERLIAARAARGGAVEPVRVLLDVEGDGMIADGAKWHGLRFLDVAGAFAAVLERIPESEGATYLSMYVATIVKELYGLQFREGMSRAEKVRLSEYWTAWLGAAR